MSILLRTYYYVMKHVNTLLKISVQSWGGFIEGLAHIWSLQKATIQSRGYVCVKNKQNLYIFCKFYAQMSIKNNHIPYSIFYFYNPVN